MPTRQGKQFRRMRGKEEREPSSGSIDMPIKTLQSLEVAYER